IRKRLDGEVPLIGFSGSPWTVGTYMVEGGSSREFSRILALAKEQPALLDDLMRVLAGKTTNYLNAQIESGAQAIQIFDTWGGVLQGDDYRRYSLEPMQRILDGLIREQDGQRIPVILFTKGAGERLSVMAESGCDALGVDWTTSLADARELTAGKVALQGNLNPSVLKEPADTIRDGVASVLASYGAGAGHVFNLGHGITPDVRPENLGVLLDAVHELSPGYHAEQ
ncbi:MAG: uroporphyrinogen decarboxylase, partial [Halioglobus sp.]|nr:uroporphyrinogen decarboxylase [Halioglobus sp.]